MPARAYYHVFDQHLLKPLHDKPVLNIADEPVWTSVYLLICLVLLTLIKARSFNRVVRVIQSTFSNQVFQQLEREELSNTKGYSIGLNLFFVLNLSFLVYKINAQHPYVFQNKTALAQFLFFFTLITLFMLFRLFSDQLLSFFTEEKRLFSDYRTSVSLVNQAFGIFLFPWLVLAEFTHINSLIFLFAGLAVVALSVLLKWYRGMVMGLLDQRIGLLQIFSYFCGLEILPLLVSAKFLIETF